MRHSKPRRTAVRNQIWQSMRILRRFTLVDLCRTVPGGVSYGNVRKFVADLSRHNIVRKVGTYTSGRAGSYQQYQLVKDSGPLYPTFCSKCGQKLTAKTCQLKNKEADKEADKEKYTQEPTDDDIRQNATAAN